MSNQSFSLHDSEILNPNLAGKSKTQVQVPSVVIDSDMTDAVMNTQMVQTGATQELISLEGVRNDGEFFEFRFLKRVLLEELGDSVCSEFNVMVVSVHALLLESGLVGFDPQMGLRNDRLYVMEEMPCKAFTMSLSYTLPQLLDNDNVADYIVLKFQSVVHFVNVYGTLAMGGSECYRVCLDEHRVAPIMNFLRLNCGEKDGWYDAKGIFEFMKSVKEALVWPLYIDLCYKTGLALPSCFMTLPSELKLKIFELLPAVDIARMGCVCSNLRTLASNDDLWKQKFAEDFGSGAAARKQRFASSLEMKKKRKRDLDTSRVEVLVRRQRLTALRLLQNPISWP